ncbi:anti-sigma factor RsbA family regulatory protein [Micromonospora sp. NPDC047620]|uniref:anti-sigma factor RsbA family regulatory protein n=1 Tax=Micromonospora sp. NPDC047620 TaxID=3364251 RepID=UPI0037195304
MTGPGGTAGTFVHEGLFYRDPGELLAGTVPFITSGLAAAEPVLVAMPGANLWLLRAAVGAMDGVRWADMTEAGRNPGRIIPWVLQAFIDEHAGRRVRIIGEPIWAGRSDTEYPACAQHEALINMAFAGRDATILCPYDVAGLDDDVLTDACATHPVLVDDAGGGRAGRTPRRRWSPATTPRCRHRRNRSRHWPTRSTACPPCARSSPATARPPGWTRTGWPTCRSR